MQSMFRGAKRPVSESRELNGNDRENDMKWFRSIVAKLRRLSVSRNNKHKMKHLYRGKATKKVRSVDSVLFQAAKAMAKTVKSVKGLLIAKNVRKLKQLTQDAEAKENTVSPEEIEEVNEKLKVIKQFDHVAVGQDIVNRSLRVKDQGKADEDTEASPTNSLIASHPKIVESLNEWKLKLKAVVREVAIAAVKAKHDAEKALAKAAAEEAKQSSSSTASGSSRKRSFDKASCTKAVFISSLSESTHLDPQTDKQLARKKAFADKLKKNDKVTSSLRQKRKAVIQKERKQDSYKPMEERTYTTAPKDASEEAPATLRQRYRKVLDDQSSSNSWSAPNSAPDIGHGHSIRLHSKSSSSEGAEVKKATPSSTNKAQLGTLHPSWAAKQSKEFTGMGIKISVDPVKPQNKKIVFD